MRARARGEGWGEEAAVVRRAAENTRAEGMRDFSIANGQDIEVEEDAGEGKVARRERMEGRKALQTSLRFSMRYLEVRECPREERSRKIMIVT
jgi:hypothetical protein